MNTSGEYSTKEEKKKENDDNEIGDLSFTLQLHNYRLHRKANYTIVR